MSNLAHVFSLFISHFICNFIQFTLILFVAFCRFAARTALNCMLLATGATVGGCCDAMLPLPLQYNRIRILY